MNDNEKCLTHTPRNEQHRHPTLHRTVRVSADPCHNVRGKKKKLHHSLKLLVAQSCWMSSAFARQPICRKALARTRRKMHSLQKMQLRSNSRRKAVVTIERDPEHLAPMRCPC